MKRIQSVPLVIGQFLEAVDQNTGIVGSTPGSNYYVRILSTLDRELLKPSASVALHKHSNALVDVLPPEADSSISMLQPDEKPDVSYSDIGGMDMQKQEMKEAVELPLTHFDLYKQVGDLCTSTSSRKHASNLRSYLPFSPRSASTPLVAC